LSVVLYGCETWSLTLRKERRLRGEITGEWRRLHNEELNDLYSSPNNFRVIKSRKIIWAGHVAYVEERRGVYRILEGRLEGRTALGRPRRRWENNIKKYLQEVGWRGMDRIALARDMDRWPALVNAVMNFRVPQNAGNFLTI